MDLIGDIFSIVPVNTDDIFTIVELVLDDFFEPRSEIFVLKEVSNFWQDGLVL